MNFAYAFKAIVNSVYMLPGIAERNSSVLNPQVTPCKEHLCVPCKEHLCVPVLQLHTESPSLLRPLGDAVPTMSEWPESAVHYESTIASAPLQQTTLLNRCNQNSHLKRPCISTTVHTRLIISFTALLPQSAKSHEQFSIFCLEFLHQSFCGTLIHHGFILDPLGPEKRDIPQCVCWNILHILG